MVTVFSFHFTIKNFFHKFKVLKDSLFFCFSNDRRSKVCGANSKCNSGLRQRCKFTVCCRKFRNIQGKKLFKLLSVIALSYKVNRNLELYEIFLLTQFYYRLKMKINIYIQVCIVQLQGIVGTLNVKKHKLYRNSKIVSELNLNYHAQYTSELILQKL